MKLIPVIYFQNIISTCNQYFRIVHEIFYFFFLCVLNLQNPAGIFTSSTSEFALAPFQMLSSHMRQVARLSNPCLSNTLAEWLSRILLLSELTPI